MSSITAIQNNEEKKKYRTQISLTVYCLFVISSLANVPFSREMRRLKLEPGEVISLALNDYLFTLALQMFIGAILVYVGFWVTAKSNLGAPLIARFYDDKKMSGLISLRQIAFLVLVAFSVAIVLLGLFDIQQSLYPVESLQSRPSKWYYVLVSLVMGINEEIIYRLGLMSLIVTAIQSWKKEPNPSPTMIWSGIFLTSIIFGLMHFPITTRFFELTPLTIFVTMAGNFITGTTFGWIFWKRGLLMAMLAHVVFDLTFHVLGSPFG